MSESVETPPPPPRGLIGALEALADETPEHGLTLGALVARLGERAFGMVFFVLAIPVCVPFLYGVPQIVALPMLALAAQMAAGRSEPWMPLRFATRTIKQADMRRIAGGARKWFGWMEALARPRLGVLTSRTGERMVGGFFFGFALCVLIPLPLTNTVPGIGLAIASLGLITRDGLFILGGLLIGLAWIALMAGGLLILGPAFFDLLREWVGALLGRG